MEAARRTGVEEVAVFIGAAVITEEALEKWQSRRLREVGGGGQGKTRAGRRGGAGQVHYHTSSAPPPSQVRQEERNMPLCLNVLLGEAFAANGATVCYSFEADSDDTLAAYAQVGVWN